MCGFRLLYDMQSDGQHREHDGDILCSLGKTCVQALGLVLAEESVSAAGDSAGETCLLTGLEQNDKNESDANYKLNYLESQYQSDHSFQNYQKQNI